MLGDLPRISRGSLSPRHSRSPPGPLWLTSKRADGRRWSLVWLPLNETSWRVYGVKTGSSGWSAISCQKPRPGLRGDRRGAVGLFRFMSANQACFPVATMARVLGVSKAGYDAWVHRPPSAHATADAALLKRVRTVHASSRQTYGAPRVHAELQGRGEQHSRKRIARLMRQAGLVGASHRHGGR